MPRPGREKPHHTAGTQNTENQRIASALRRAARSDALACVDAHALSKTLGVSPIAVGQAADDANIRIVRCQLGLFDQLADGSTDGHAMVEAPSRLAKSIADNMVHDRLPCRKAWAIADAFGLQRCQFGAYCDTAGIKISKCQLGTF